DFVPARFTEGVSKDVTKTYKVDFTMDGSQLAEQLVGNLAIRGLGGNNTFVINTIVITDDEGNMLVNYDKDIQSGIAQIKLDVSQVYNADGGIIVTGHNENVSVYAIDGRLVKQTIANQDTYIPLQRGLYIVRVGANQAVKALVK
ncbi:MAG: T9SS type A sorting domain-containing protein, partial [Candidatus Azobacteroides sp.]|nr:T9SS type A sorting domain-containing protein [Candidatus Azobacteroides sp.]